MKQSWISGLNEDQKKEMQKEFKSAALLRRRLGIMLTEKIDIARSSSRQKSNYENASWAYQQADQMGYERALAEIISLLDEKVV